MKHLLFKYPLYLLLIALISSCKNETTIEGGFSDQEHIEITCDMEQVSGDHFVNGEFYFGSGVLQSDDYSRSGKYSVKVNKETPYALGFAFDKVKKGNYITASVWRKSKDGVGVIRFANERKELNIVDYHVVNTEGEWEQLVISFIAEEDFEQIKMYVYNPNDDVYFDDLHIDYYKTKPVNPMTDDGLKIEIPAKGMNKLMAFRDEALALGVISEKQKKYIKANIIYKGKEIPVKLRFKGDWTDHLQGEKWSFRIKVTGDNAINGLKSFSIQSPHTRGFLHEWFMHQLYEKEGVLTTTYDFVPVSINGNDLGVFALEEHFDKQLIESRERREGPILKFNESGFWEQMKYANESDHWISTLYYEAAEVLPFKKNRTMKSPTLKQNFEVARSLMLRYKEFDQNLEDIFELKDLAKYYALADFGNVDHGLRWHNMRMYYNPVTTKLEQIAYDCYTEHLNGSRRTPILGMDTSQTVMEGERYLTYQVFNHSEFKQLYIECLKKYSSKEYLESVKSELEEEFLQLEKMIQLEYPYYRFNMESFAQNADSIAHFLEDYQQLEIQYSVKPSKYNSLKNHPVYFKEIGLKVYSTPTTDSTINKYGCYSFHTEDATFVGYELKQYPDSIIPLSGMVSGYTNKPAYYQFNAPVGVRNVYFSVNNIHDSVLKTKVGKWHFSQAQTEVLPEIKLSGTPLTGKSIIVDEVEKKITIQKGAYKFDANVIVPKGYTLNIDAGVTIDLVNGAAFVSYSPIKALGTNKELISIKSSDKTGQGLVVVTDGEESELRHVKFEHLTAMNQNKWTLTGAVTFYETDIKISNCTFTNNNCEDGLNLIRSSFIMDSVEVSYTTADGFDADFCTGVISNSSFIASDNDCIDVSGSVVEVVDCIIDNSGDKGISGGEGSTVTVNNCTVKNVNIGVASKDQSTVFVNGLNLENATCAFAAYQKKPEFGQAVIEVNSSQEVNCKDLMLIDLGSVINYHGKNHESTTKVNVDSLYAPFK